MAALGCDACFFYLKASFRLERFAGFEPVSEKRFPGTCTLNTVSCWKVVKPSVKPVTCRAGVVCTVCMCAVCMCVSCVTCLTGTEEILAVCTDPEGRFSTFFWQNSCHFLQPPLITKHHLLHSPLLKLYSCQLLLRLDVLHQAACTAGSVECPNNFKRAYSYGQ